MSARFRYFPVAAGGLLALGLCRALAAGPVSVGTVERILPPDVSQRDQFGRRIDLDGDILVVGSPQDSDAGSSAGSAYLFTYDEKMRWRQVRKIFASDAAEFDEFGRDVDLDGELLVVGAPEGLFADGSEAPAGTNAGSAYLFRRDAGGAENWGQVSKLVASDGQLGDDFGRAVAVSGGTAIAGARLSDEAGFFSGSAYVFEVSAAEADTWAQTQKLTASDAAGGAFFGEDVAIDGGVVVIGAPGDLFAAESPGKAYLYTASPVGWNETQVLTGSAAVAGDRFGGAVTVSGDTLAVGSVGADVDRVYLFERVPGTFDWAETAVLTTPCGEINTQFGDALALKDNLLVVGAPFDDQSAENAGALFLFERNTGGPGQWGFVAKVISADSVALDQFGITVGVSGDAIATGAPGSDMAARDAGSAYSARLYAADADADGVPDLLDNCLDVANGPDSVPESGPSQQDTDADGFGNMCDADLNNDCAINFGDLAIMQSVFFGADENADFNSDGTVDFFDLSMMIGRFFVAPGPSAVQTCDPMPPVSHDDVEIITSLSCETP